MRSRSMLDVAVVSACGRVAQRVHARLRRAKPIAYSFATTISNRQGKPGQVQDTIRQSCRKRSIELQVFRAVSRIHLQMGRAAIHYMGSRNIIPILGEGAQYVAEDRWRWKGEGSRRVELEHEGERGEGKA